LKYFLIIILYITMVKKKDVKCFTKEGKDGDYTTCVDKKTGKQLRKGKPKPKAKPKLKIVDKVPEKPKRSKIALTTFQKPKAKPKPKPKAKSNEQKFEEYFATHTGDWDKHYKKALKSVVGSTKKIKEEKAETIAFDKLRADHKASMKPKKKKLVVVKPNVTALTERKGVKKAVKTTKLKTDREKTLGELHGFGNVKTLGDLFTGLSHIEPALVDKIVGHATPSEEKRNGKTFDEYLDEDPKGTYDGEYDYALQVQYNNLKRPEKMTDKQKERHMEKAADHARVMLKKEWKASGAPVGGEKKATGAPKMPQEFRDFMEGKTEMKSARYSNQVIKILGLTPKGVKIRKVTIRDDGTEREPGNQQTLPFLNFINSVRRGEIPRALIDKMPFHRP